MPLVYSWSDIFYACVAVFDHKHEFLTQHLLPVPFRSGGMLRNVVHDGKLHKLPVHVRPWNVEDAIRTYIAASETVLLEDDSNWTAVQELADLLAPGAREFLSEGDVSSYMLAFNNFGIRGLRAFLNSLPELQSMQLHVGPPGNIGRKCSGCRHFWTPE